MPTNIHPEDGRKPTDRETVESLEWLASQNGRVSFGGDRIIVNTGAATITVPAADGFVDAIEQAKLDLDQGGV